MDIEASICLEKNIAWNKNINLDDRNLSTKKVLASTDWQKSLIVSL